MFGKSYKEIWSIDTGSAFLVTGRNKKPMEQSAGILYVSGPMKVRVAYWAVFFVVVLGFGAGTEVYAQAKRPNSQTSPRKFDEFGVVGHCDLGARLDNFAIALLQEPSVVGNVIVYGPEGEGVGSGRQRMMMMKEYLMEARGLPDHRIKTIYAGRDKDFRQPKVQLWITPPGARLPEPPKFETNIDTFKGRFIQDETEDLIDFLWGDDVGPGFNVPIDAAFADLMQQQKKAIAYVVTYNGERSAPGSAKRAAEKQLERLKEQNVDLGRVKTIFAGVRKKTTLELWLTAPGDPPPASDAGPEPPPTKNVLITDQVAFTLGYPENERAVFNRMLEVLRAQPTLKVVVVVRLEGPQPEPEPEPESTPVTASSPPQPAEPLSPPVDIDPPADLPKLVEKWRNELINTHKIRPERFIVLFATAPPDESGNYVELWAVPPGQPLPDPNADEEDEEDPEKTEKDPPVSDVVQNAKRRP